MKELRLLAVLALVLLGLPVGAAPADLEAAELEAAELEAAELEAAQPATSTEATSPADDSTACDTNNPLEGAIDSPILELGLSVPGSVQNSSICGSCSLNGCEGVPYGTICGAGKYCISPGSTVCNGKLLCRCTSSGHN
jgi:hypothetical protein